MARTVAAGCLVVARFGGELRFLVVHPSGSYNRRKPWSIPKGLVEPGERPEDAALRETREETGLQCRLLAPLGEVEYEKSRKRVIGFLAEPASPVVDPVLSGHDWEIDRAEFVPPDEARARLHPAQQVFVDRALEALRRARGLDPS